MARGGMRCEGMCMSCVECQKAAWVANCKDPEQSVPADKAYLLTCICLGNI